MINVIMLSVVALTWQPPRGERHESSGFSTLKNF